MTDIDIVNGMSNDKLFRLILNRIWIRWDAGGISLGRSLRAGLLEGVINIHPNPLPANRTGFGLEDLLTLFAKRGSAMWDRQLLLDLGIEGLPSHYLKLFLIREIQRWYEWDERTNQWPLHSEKKIFDTICEILSVGEHLAQFDDVDRQYSPEQLIAETGERWRLNVAFDLISPAFM